MKIHQKKNIRWNGIVRREKKMKSVIVYASVHHGNTKKLVEKIAEGCKKPDIHSETQRENNGNLTEIHC